MNEHFGVAAAIRSQEEEPLVHCPREEKRVQCVDTKE